MEETIACPSCGRRVLLPEHLSGQEVRCPGCTGVFVARDNAPPKPPVIEGAVQTGVPMATPVSPRDYHAERGGRSAAVWEEIEDDRDRPAPVSLPEELPGGGLATAVMVLLAVNVLADLGAMAVAAALLQQPANARPEINLAECLQPLVYLPTAIVFCVWMYRSYKNLTLFGVRGLKYSAGWAAGSFFVPILNLFRPYQIAQEMWQASDPDVPPEEPTAWRRTPSSGLMVAWWAFWIISNVLYQIVFQMTMKGQGDEEALAVSSIIADGVSCVAALFAILVVKSLRARQERKFQALVGRWATQS